MNNLEAKSVMETGQEVLFRGIKYKRINALIYRQKDKGNYQASAEIMDYNENSIFIVPIEMLRMVNDEDVDEELETTHENKEIIDLINKTDELLISGIESLYRLKTEEAIDIINEALKNLINVSDELFIKRITKDKQVTIEQKE